MGFYIDKILEREILKIRARFSCVFFFVFLGKGFWIERRVELEEGDNSVDVGGFWDRGFVFFLDMSDCRVRGR